MIRQKTNIAFIRYEGCSLWAVLLYIILGCHFGTSQVSARRNYPLTDNEMNNIGEKKNSLRGRLLTYKLAMLDHALRWDTHDFGYENRHIHPLKLYPGMSVFIQFLIFISYPILMAVLMYIIVFLIVEY